MNSIPNINIGYADFEQKAAPKNEHSAVCPRPHCGKTPRTAAFSRARTGVKATSIDDRLLHRFRSLEACQSCNHDLINVVVE